ncbi:hypothetical protein D3C80_1485810 [compost metagenome]
MTLPPTQAPMALPTLKAPMFRVATRFGADWPTRTTLTCSAGTAANDAAAQKNRVISAGSSAWLVQLNSAETTAMAASTPARVAPRRQSARRPPITLPTVRPTPISTSDQVMPRGVTPVTSPSIGAT